jgi:hypothetical protein
MRGYLRGDYSNNLYEGINSHDCHVGLTLGVVHEVQVDQLFQFKVVCLHTVDNIREKGRYIFANRHRGYNLK